MVKMTIKDKSLPPGEYLAEFDGVEESTHEKYGPGLQWRFVVVKGRLKDAECFRTTKVEPTTKNSCGRFLASLAGKSPQDEMDIDPEDYEGQRYIISVRETPNGQSTRVETFIAEKVDDEEEASAKRHPGQEPDGPATSESAGGGAEIPI